MLDVKNLNDLPLTLRVEEVGEILGISRAGAYNLVKQTNFPVIKISKRLVVPRDAFIKWMERKAEEPIVESA